MTTSVWRSSDGCCDVGLVKFATIALDRLLVAPVRQRSTAPERECGGVAELVRPREQVHVEPRERLAPVRLEDVEGLHVLVPDAARAVAGS